MLDMKSLILRWSKSCLAKYPNGEAGAPDWQKSCMDYKPFHIADLMETWANIDKEEFVWLGT